MLWVVMGEWKPLLARLSVFPVLATHDQLPTALQVYRKVFDSDPDSFNKQSNALAPSGAQGIFKSLMVQCVSAPTRIDLQFTAKPNVNDFDLPLILNPAQLNPDIQSLTSRLGGIVPHASRIATFLHCVAPRRTLKEANAVVVFSMPKKYRPELEAEDDFIFQVNNPVKGAVYDIVLNLITKWAVDKLAMQPVLLSPTQGQIVAPSIEHIAGSISFDHNNAPSPSLQLNEDMQRTLLHECWQHTSHLQRQYELGLEGF